VGPPLVLRGPGGRPRLEPEVRADLVAEPGLGLRLAAGRNKSFPMQPAIFNGGCFFFIDIKIKSRAARRREMRGRWRHDPRLASPGSRTPRRRRRSAACTPDPAPKNLIWAQGIFPIGIAGIHIRESFWGPKHSFWGSKSRGRCAAAGGGGRRSARLAVARGRSNHSHTALYIYMENQ
jgi:hypothetical protein